MRRLWSHPLKEKSLGGLYVKDLMELNVLIELVNARNFLRLSKEYRKWLHQRGFKEAPWETGHEAP